MNSATAAAMPRLRALCAVVTLALCACAPADDDAPSAGFERTWDVPQHLVLISIDTLRADRLGCYGHDRDTSPNLDAFAARSLQFLQATAAASDTTPSHMSMFTGLLPPVHRQFNVRPSKADMTVELLPSSMPMLAERLSEAGYFTVAFTDGGYLNRELRFDRGFDEFDRAPETVDVKIDRVLERVADLDPQQPTFLFVHTYEVHAPYVPPREHDRWTDPTYDGPMLAKVEGLRATKQRGGQIGSEGFLPSPRNSDDDDRQYLSDLYDGGVHFMDEHVGRLLDVLSQPPWRDNTAIVVLADHGEAFAEHQTFGHRTVYEPVTHVPVMIHVPEGPVGRVREPVSGVDVTPTVLDLLDLPAPRVTDGVSMLSAIAPDRPVMSFHGALRLGGGASLRIGDEKVMRNRESRAWLHFDLGADPGEQAALDATLPPAPELTARIEAETARLDELSDVLRAGADAERAELSPETIASLKALGYLDEDEQDG